MFAILAFQGARLALDLHSAKSDADRLKSDLAQHDLSSARATARDLQAHSAAAHRHAGAFALRALSHVPLIGPDVRAVRTLSAVLDQTAQQTMPPALRLLDATTGGLRGADGQFDLAKISSLGPLLGELTTAADRAQAQVQTIAPQDLLLPPVSKVARQAQDIIGGLDASAHAGVTAVQLLPEMMGQSGPRHYLMMAQNNAEVRATGGLIGSVAPLTVDHGEIRLGKQEPNYVFPIRRTPIIPLTPDETATYGPIMGEDMRDTNITPDFARTGQIVAAMWQDRFHRKVDGVISVDPIALSMFLQATGPVKAGSETFTSANVAGLLLNKVYLRFAKPSDQDAYFAAAASQIFTTVSHGADNERAVVEQVANAASQGRLLVWSARPEEQRLLDGTTVGGALDRRDSRGTDLRFDLNDATRAKMEYYLRYTPTVSSEDCSDAGRQTLQMKVALTSSAPRDSGKLPRYITGLYTPPSKKGTMRMNVRFYAPPGGKIVGVEANGHHVKVEPTSIEGREVGLVVLELKPQQHAEFTATFRTRAGATAAPTLRWTPGLRDEPNHATADSSCG